MRRHRRRRASAALRARSVRLLLLLLQLAYRLLGSKDHMRSLLMHMPQVRLQAFTTPRDGEGSGSGVDDQGVGEHRR
jgi:hypothetical protein